MIQIGIRAQLKTLYYKHIFFSEIQDGSSFQTPLTPDRILATQVVFCKFYIINWPSHYTLTQIHRSHCYGCVIEHKTNVS